VIALAAYLLWSSPHVIFHAAHRESGRAGRDRDPVARHADLETASIPTELDFGRYRHAQEVTDSMSVKRLPRALARRAGTRNPPYSIPPYSSPVEQVHRPRMTVEGAGSDRDLSVGRAGAYDEASRYGVCLLATLTVACR
jgi:hypothetical protein